MSEEKTRKVTVGEVVKEYPLGTKFRQIADELFEDPESDVILVKAGGRIEELFKRLEHDCTLEFITTRTAIGHEAYRRTAVFILLKAILDVGGKKMSDSAVIHYALGNGLYFTAGKPGALTPELLSQIKTRMTELIEKNVPIMKRTVRTEDAIGLFHRHHMYSKEKLFHYRVSSAVNLYSLENYDDYYFGNMADGTGVVRYFDLELYDEGFVLVLPEPKSPRTLKPFVPPENLFHVMKDTQEWVEKLHVATVGELNDRIAKEGIRGVVLAQEALHEAKISSIAQTIQDRGDVKFVMIAGPSSSGKTSFSYRLATQLAARGLRPHPLAMDNYFLNREITPLDEFGEKNFEALEALDLDQFHEDMLKLLNGKRVEIPSYNFAAGQREYKGDYLQLGKEDILVIEGIHGMNPHFGKLLPEESRIKIYISALTQLSIDEHNRIPSTDGRLIRRIVRDARTRGFLAEGTIRQWPSVRRGEEQNIFPNQENSDIMFNSSLVYELACLKVYAEPLLFAIERTSAEYEEARRLLKFLDYFVPAPSTDIPNNSLLREFLGGSCFPV